MRNADHIRCGCRRTAVGELNKIAEDKECHDHLEDSISARAIQLANSRSHGRQQTPAGQTIDCQSRLDACATVDTYAQRPETSDKYKYERHG